MTARTISPLSAAMDERLVSSSADSPEWTSVFDAYVSLGDSCEAGLQFVRIGYKESSFFRFTYSRLNSTLALIENDFEGVFLKENLEPHPGGMVNDRRYNIQFHSKLKVATTPDGRLSFIRDAEFEATYNDEFAKVRYLVDKWISLVRSGKRVLYFVRSISGSGRKDALRIADLFARKYPGHDHAILFLQTKERCEAAWGIPRVINRYLPRFAPIENAHDADLAAWNELFADFPLANPKESRTNPLKEVGSRRLATSFSDHPTGVLSLEQWVAEASKSFELGHWAEAKRAFTEAINLAPSDPNLRSALGIVNFNLGDHPEAARAFEAALALAPENPAFWTQLAIVLLENQRLPEAEGALRRAIALKSDDAPTVKLLVACCKAQGRESAAQEAADLLRSLEDAAQGRTDQPTVSTDKVVCDAFPQSVERNIVLDEGLSLEIGECSYIHDNRVRNPSGARTRITIGRFCSIATELTVIGYDHRMDWVTTYPFLDTWHRSFWRGTDTIPYPAEPEFGGNINRGDIVIGNDVWIGYGVKLFKGVTIGDGAVIGACALVTKDVAPYTVVAGVPARPNRQRFTDREIEFLRRIAWWNWPPAKINRYLEYLCSARIADLELKLAEDSRQDAPLNHRQQTGHRSGVTPAAPDVRRQAQRRVEAFIQQAREKFCDVAAPTLNERHLGNSRLLANREQILALMPKNGCCAEVGTQTGWFAKKIVAEMKPAKFHIYDVDFTPFDYPAFSDLIQRGLVELHEGDSSTCLSQAPDESFDFIYIDGDHSYEGVKRDIAQAVRKVKKHGWIICNDYTPYSPLENIKYGVYRAVNELCIQHEFEIVYLALQKWGYHDVALRRIGS